MNDKYVMPKGTTIGHVHLKVSNLQQSLDFYCGLLGYEVMMTYGDQAAFIAAGDYHHHIGLNVWHSKNAPPADKNSVGLFHTHKKRFVTIHRFFSRFCQKPFVHRTLALVEKLPLCFHALTGSMWKTQQNFSVIDRGHWLCEGEISL